MFQLTFLFLGVMAAGATWLAMSDGMDDPTRTIGAVFAMVAWAYWAVSAFRVEVAHGDTVTSDAYIGLVALGFAAAAIMLLVSFKFSFALISGRGRTEEFNPHA